MSKTSPRRFYRCARVTAAGLAILPSIVVAQDDSREPARPTPKPPSWFASISAHNIYNNIPLHAKNAVPGLPGITFQAGTGTTHFDRPFGSANGNWILTALTTQATTLDEVLLVNGTLAAQEGTPAPWTAVDNFGTFDTKCSINASGQYAFPMNVTPSTVNDDFVIKVSSGPSYTVLAQEAAAIPYLPGATYDDTIDSVVLSDDGRVGFSADLIDGAVTTTTDDVLEFGAVLLGQEGVTIPAGQAGGGTAHWENFDLNDYFVSADGNHYAVLGDLDNATTDDGVAVVDGAVVLQENQIIPGSGYANPIDNAGFVGVSMDPAGNWYVRGNNDVTEDDWVVRNGVVVAAVGLSVEGGAELWDDTTFADCFFMHVGNGAGDYVIGGVTSNVDPLLNGVLAHSSAGVICRESDPIDLDGDGIFNDDAFFNTFGNDDGVLTDAGVFYFTATIKNAAGTLIGQGFFDITLLTAPTVYCTAKTNSLACVPAIGWTGTSSASSISGFVVSGSNVINNKSGLLFYGSSGQASNPFQGGTLCVASPIRRTPGVNSGGNPPPNDCSGQYTIDMNAFASGNLGGNPHPALSVIGSVINCQWWGRDPGFVAPNNTTLSDALEYVVGP